MGPSHQQRSQYRAYNPGNEFFTANSVLLTLGQLTAGDVQDLLEDLPSDLLHTPTGKNRPRVDVHIIAHAFKHGGVTRDFDTRRGFAPKTTAAAGSKHTHIGASRHHTGDA